MASSAVSNTFGGQKKNLHNIMFSSNKDNIVKTIVLSPQILFKYFVKFWQVTGIKLENMIFEKNVFQLIFIFTIFIPTQ